jgi:hypothetical protein
MTQEMKYDARMYTKFRWLATGIVDGLLLLARE